MFVVCLLAIALFRFALGTYRNHRWTTEVKKKREQGLEPLITLGPGNRPMVRWVPIGALK
jgi:hypothetical protein